MLKERCSGLGGGCGAFALQNDCRHVIAEEANCFVFDRELSGDSGLFGYDASHFEIPNGDLSLGIVSRDEIRLDVRDKSMSPHERGSLRAKEHATHAFTRGVRSPHDGGDARHQLVQRGTIIVVDELLDCFEIGANGVIYADAPLGLRECCLEAGELSRQAWDTRDDVP